MVQVFANNPVAVAANGPVQFTGFKSQKGCTAVLNSGGVRLNSPGVYSIIANFSFAPTEAGDVTVKLETAGNPSSTDAATATATAGGTVNLTIPSLVRVDEAGCCSGGVIIGYRVNLAGTLNSANAIVTKVV